VQSFIKERDPGNHPLVQVMFVLQNEDLSLPMIDGLRLEELHRDRFAAIMDLLFDLQESGGGIAGNIEFNSNVYTEQTIAVLWRSLTYLMRSIVRNADQPITRLSTIDEDEYRVLSQAWMNLQRGRTEIQFWHRQAVDSPYWEDYLELAERDGLLMSAYLAVSEY
jgi:non-ribosomal peptide synthetase component F